jgi:flagellar M-ring protein FliF
LEFLERIRTNLAALDTRSKVGIGLLALVLVLGVTVLAAVFTPSAKFAIYTEVPREELTRMGRILAESGIDFEVNPDRGAIMVDTAKVEEGRLVLAEHGLPSNSGAGYEIFDNVNALGLTSFMQDVTRTRAIEGELARTIQMIEGIRTARVHVVLAQDKGYRARAQEPPTASVVVGTVGRVSPETVGAIQHLVAAAVRGMEAKNVTILKTDGSLLSSADGGSSGGSLRLAELEARYERELSEKVNAALGAHLGPENYRVSVTAKLNSDSRRTDETIFFPESRVERSVRTVREEGNQSHSSNAEPMTVTENIPEEETPSASGETSSENREKREETANYEISQKKVMTVSEGYVVDRLNIALVVSRARMAELLGEEATDERIDAELAKLKETVAAAIGFTADRGDVIQVSALQFLPREELTDYASQGGFGSFIGRHFSAIASIIGLLAGIAVFAFLVVRPILSFLARPIARSEDDELAAAGRLLSGPGGPLGAAGFPQGISGSAAGALAAAAGMAEAETPVTPRQVQVGQQIASLIEASDERAASVIRQWLQQDREATT